MPERRCGLSGRDQDQGGADRMPRVHEAQYAAVDRNATACILRQASEQQAGQHAERHVLHRQQCEHRHEHELGRHRRPGPDLEVDSRCQRVGRDEDDHGRKPCCPRRVGQQCERDRGCQERAAEQEGGKSIAIPERPRGQLPRALDQRIGFDLRAAQGDAALGRGGSRHGRRRHVPRYRRGGVIP